MIFWIALNYLAVRIRDYIDFVSGGGFEIRQDETKFGYGGDLIHEIWSKEPSHTPFMDDLRVKNGEI
ncbi:uncharacterized protein N7483_012933 [Penicillium malachiteum]|uniref:uncharacterized protein n=1 Tax=Penicillium malachiteum TaxID=1324776 RepID=UPI0025493E41|nr:uncharacterized protein N7483_012933 [Penicillium malachiteum]KAJ5715752.1 hypothetical protein N7483_012933 [Penicillium malachiteum]